MKYFNKLLLFVVLTVGFARDIVAYRYTVTNLTGTRIKVQLFFTPFQKIEKIMEPFDTEAISTEGVKTIACLTKLMVSPFDEEKERWLGEIKASIKEIDADQFNKTKAAISEFTSALKLGLPPSSAIFKAKMQLMDKAAEAIGKATVGATALFGASLCRNRDFLLILDQLVLPNGRPVTIKKIVGGEILEEPLVIPYALSSP
jgi:hypothetical protein